MIVRRVTLLFCLLLYAVSITLPGGCGKGKS